MGEHMPEPHAMAVSVTKSVNGWIPVSSEPMHIFKLHFFLAPSFRFHAMVTWTAEADRDLLLLALKVRFHSSYVNDSNLMALSIWDDWRRNLDKGLPKAP